MPAELGSLLLPSLRALLGPGPRVCPRAPSSPLRSASHPISASSLACSRCPSAVCLPWDRSRGKVRALLGFGDGNLLCHPSRQQLRRHFVALGCPGLSIRFPFPQRGCSGSGSCLPLRPARPGSGRALSPRALPRCADALHTSPGARFAGGVPGSWPPGEGTGPGADPTSGALHAAPIPGLGPPSGQCGKARAPPLPRDGLGVTTL